MTPHQPLGDGAEFDAIRLMLSRWGSHAEGIGGGGREGGGTAFG